MSKQRRELVTLTFEGPRFEDHGLDLDVLDELIAYKALLVETAKELWRKRNPTRQRLPKNFEDSLCLKFYELGGGSTAVPLMREVEHDDSALPFEPPPDEFDEAAGLIADVVEAGAQDSPFPQEFPKSSLPVFAGFGRTLREDEACVQKLPQRAGAVRYSAQVRDRLLRRSESDYEDVVSLAGEVRAADLDGCNFTLRVGDGTKIPGKFAPDQESAITEALREHASRRLLVRGRAEFSAPDGATKRIVSVEEVSVQIADEAPFDPDARPIWEAVVELGASVPDGEWATVPTDLSKNLDHYLYGAPKVEE